MGDYDVNPNCSYITDTVDYMLAKATPPVPRAEDPDLDIIFGRRPDINGAVSMLSAKDDDAQLNEPSLGPFEPHTVVPLPYSDPKMRSMIYKIVNNHRHESVDLGSGDFKKGLEGFVVGGKYRGPSRLIMDKEKPRNYPVYDQLEGDLKTQEKYLITYKHFDFSNPDLEFLHSYMEEKPQALLTSTNALMHSPSIEDYKKYDMLYTLPMPSVLYTKGCVVPRGENAYEFLGAPGKLEYDHSEQLDNAEGDLQGLAVNFAKRTIRVKPIPMNDYFMRRHLELSLDRKPVRAGRLPKGTLRPPFFKKIDGVTMVMKKSGKRLLVKTPVSFEVYTAVGDDGTPFSDFEIEGEYVEKPGVFILHAVHGLGGVRIPTFMKKLEKDFVNSYTFEGLPFTLHCKKAYDTIDACLTEEESFGDYKVVKAEGVICASVSYRGRVAAKVFETMDLDLKSAERLVDEVYNNFGVTVQLFQASQAVTEYLFYRDGEEVILKADRVRGDKTAPNDMQRCIAMVRDLLEGDNHSLTDYMDISTLSKYGIVNKDLATE